MSRPIIHARNVGKHYRLGETIPRYGTLGDSLRTFARRTRKRLAEGGRAHQHWALQDVNFDIAPGEAVALIGRNGAGKSTLLKILSRITPPSTGRIELYGRVSSLLEVGTGFHGELSGRENIFLNGAVLGMRHHEIARRFDEIVAFSEVEKFLDTPVKRYSSGMIMRLAFAVAAHLEPEVLIVDEVLAVGDAAFQRKCLGKMQDVAGQGRTVLFVSHQMQAVSTLTRRAILLEGGHVVQDGPTSEVIAEYLRTMESTEGVWTGPALPNEPRITRMEVVTSDVANVSLNGASLEVAMEITTPQPMQDGVVWLQVCNDFEQPVLWSAHTEENFGRKAGVYRLRCVIPNLRLYQGRYTLRARLNVAWRLLHEVSGVCPFSVAMWGQHTVSGWPPRAATYTEDLTWSMETVRPLVPDAELALEASVAAAPQSVSVA